MILSVPLPESTEQKIAWDLRGAWIKGRRVSVRLNDAVCVISRVAGRVVYVAPTGAFAEIQEPGGGEPWRISCVDVLALRFPHFSEPLDGSGAALPPEEGQAAEQLSILTVLGAEDA